MNFDKIDEAVSSCHTLLDALFAVSSLGAFSGTIELQDGNLHGWIAFHQKKVTSAVIAETAQTGDQALQALASLDGAKCRYLPPWVKPDIEPVPAVATSQPAATNQSSSSDVQIAVADDTAHDDTTKIFGEELLAMGGGGSQPQGAAPIWRRPMDESEFRAGVFENDQHAAFMKAEGRLGNPDAPPRKDTHFVRTHMESAETAEPEPQRRAEAALAKAGFTTDFHDRSAAPDAWSHFHGDPANQPTATVQIDRRRLDLRPYAAPATVALLCIATFVLPKLVWSSATVHTDNQAQRKQLQRILNTAYQEEDSDRAQRQQAFILPEGSNRPAPSTTGCADTTVQAAQQAAVAYAAGDERSQMTLAQNQAGLKTLEHLIEQYIAAGQFRQARFLAAAGFRSSLCTAAQKQKFWQWFTECLNK